MITRFRVWVFDNRAVIDRFMVAVDNDMGPAFIDS